MKKESAGLKFWVQNLLVTDYLITFALANRLTIYLYNEWMLKDEQSVLRRIT